jgi:recombination protein RecA
MAEKKKEAYRLAVDLPDTEKFSTGLLSLDNITGGGLVIGSIVEIYGEESDGKTTLGIQLLSEAQNQGLTTLFIDAEHSATKEYLGKFLDTTKLNYIRPACGEEAFASLNTFWKNYTDNKCMILIDSVPALISEVQIQTGGDTAYGGSAARVLASNLPEVLRKYGNSIVIFINQVRDKMNSLYPTLYTPGGHSLKHYAGHRLRVDTTKVLFDSEKKAKCKNVKIKCEKNKFGIPFMECNLELILGEGYSRESDLVEVALKKGIMEQSGAWIKVEGNDSFVEG